jgi:hypothetical protein
VKKITLNIPAELAERLDFECKHLKMKPAERILQALEINVAPARNLKVGWLPQQLKSLESFLRRIPGVTWTAVSPPDTPRWWVKLTIDLKSEFAWNVVQELGHVLNLISLNQRLPTVFMPVSPPPYLNGGPAQFLAWVIEAQIAFLDPEYIRKTLEGRLPNPVDDPEKWRDVDREPPDGGERHAE